jgi:hypothetical protein
MLRDVARCCAMLRDVVRCCAMLRDRVFIVHLNRPLICKTNLAFLCFVAKSRTHLIDDTAWPTISVKVTEKIFKVAEKNSKSLKKIQSHRKKFKVSEKNSKSKKKNFKGKTKKISKAKTKNFQSLNQKIFKVKTNKVSISPKKISTLQKNLQISCYKWLPGFWSERRFILA